MVIPCYNEVDTLETLVAAVRGAEVEDLEIILVDNGSSNDG